VKEEVDRTAINSMRIVALHLPRCGLNEGHEVGVGHHGAIPWSLNCHRTGVIQGAPRRQLASITCQESHAHGLVSTTRKRAWPDNIRSKPLEASDIEYVSITGRTPLRAAKRSVSSESCDVPDGCPAIDRL
jgi:hypothetical protein